MRGTTDTKRIHSLPAVWRLSRRLTGVAAAVVVCSAALPARAAEAPASAADLFQTTAVWDVHFALAPQQWADMEPKGGTAFGGPSMIVAPGFLKYGDADGDGKITRDEFRRLADKWFGEWDSDQAGALDLAALRTGMNKVFELPNFAGGGGGGRGIGISLQGDEGKRNGLASAMGVEFKYVHADLTFAGRQLKDVAVRYKGNGTFLQSRGSLKRSLKVDLNRFDKNQKFAGVTTLNFHSNVTDAGWMNEVLSHRLYRDAGSPAPRTAYARVTLTVPGKYDRQYVGLYSVVEEVDADFAKAALGAADATLFKPVTPAPFDDLGDDWAKYKQTYDPRGKVDPARTRRVIDFAKLVTHATDAEFAAKAGSFLDLDAFAKYMAVTVYLSTLDSILSVGQNYFVALDPGSMKLKFIPWDLDHSFGQFPLLGTQGQRNNLSIDKPWKGENRFLSRVFGLGDFRQKYRKELEDLGRTVFQPARIQKQVDEVGAAIRPAVAAEGADKAAKLDKIVAGQSVPPPGSDGGLASLFNRVQPIKAFVTVRAKSVADQLAGTSKGQTLDAGGFNFGAPPPDAAPATGPATAPTTAPAAFGLGVFLAPPVLAGFDANKDGRLSRDEWAGGLDRWFQEWDVDKAGVLTASQLRTGIDKTFAPNRGPPPAATRPATAPAAGR